MVWNENVVFNMIYMYHDREGRDAKYSVKMVSLSVLHSINLDLLSQIMKFTKYDYFITGAAVC